MPLSPGTSSLDACGIISPRSCSCCVNLLHTRILFSDSKLRQLMKLRMRPATVLWLPFLLRPWLASASLTGHEGPLRKPIPSWSVIEKDRSPTRPFELTGSSFGERQSFLAILYLETGYL